MLDTQFWKQNGKELLSFSQLVAKGPQYTVNRELT